MEPGGRGGALDRLGQVIDFFAGGWPHRFDLRCVVVAKVEISISGEISFEEFVSGCMQLQGPAQSVQLARMRYENKVMRQELRHVGREQLRQL